MTQRQVHSMILALAVITTGLVLAADAGAQVVTYYYGDPVVYQVHYYRVYQGSFWYWSPALGWHTHARYIDVPYWVPTTYVYPQPSTFPAITTSYVR